MAILTRRTLLSGAATAAGAVAAAPAVGKADAPPAPVADPDDLAPRQRLLMDFGWRFALGHAHDTAWGDGVSKVVDVLGFNYWVPQMEPYHAKVPSQPIIASEAGSTVSTRGAYVHDDKAHVSVAYDREHPWWASTAEAWWTIAAERPYIAGGFIWTGFDYRGEPTPFGRWPSVASYFGVMDS